MTNLSPFEENNKFVDGCMVCKPGDLKCDKLVLTRGECSCIRIVGQQSRKYVYDFGIAL